MTGPQLVYPDTGLPAWWCICAANDCEARAFGPFRTREDALREAELAATKDCENAHFTSTRVGHQMQVDLPRVTFDSYDWIADWEPVKDEMRALRGRR